MAALTPYRSLYCCGVLCCTAAEDMSIARAKVQLVYHQPQYLMSTFALAVAVFYLALLQEMVTVNYFLAKAKGCVLL